MILCDYCGQTMSSAPSHMEHAPVCFRHKLWKAIDAYRVSPTANGRAVQRLEIERLLKAAGR